MSKKSAVKSKAAPAVAPQQEPSQVSEEQWTALEEALTGFLADLKAEQTETQESILAEIDTDEIKTLVQAHRQAEDMAAYHTRQMADDAALLEEKQAELRAVETEIAGDPLQLETLKYALDQAEKEQEQARLAHAIWLDTPRADATRQELDRAKQRASRARQAVKEHEEGAPARLAILEKRRATLAQDIDTLQETVQPVQRTVSELDRQASQLRHEIAQKRVQAAQATIQERQERVHQLREEAYAQEADTIDLAKRVASALREAYPEMRSAADAIVPVEEDAIVRVLSAHLELLTRLQFDGAALEQSIEGVNIAQALALPANEIAAYMRPKISRREYAAPQVNDPFIRHRLAQGNYTVNADVGLQHKINQIKALLEHYQMGRAGRS